ncbi:polyketide cyclase [Streptomyces abyssalis]|uniref:Polyketide cyclase n=1 Tax=Streptomyces abyssalis TaxID=933944 RepID=A0A1E7JUD0_9ACTN|nr:SRPBCC family protein [Streptomyces abyssalis]OEU88786.1 polyketide cyclase [Streptomyces abyssalis]OEU93555.1 polyketide cyclase [Streptomyces abyssalis]OEV32150.1 polyketide cyclase [Streptomyces nanshensis]
MKSSRHRFVFRSVWRLDAHPARVFAALERAGEYPEWWPQVREVHALEESSGRGRIRSVLPFDLRITGRAVRHDPAAGVLEMEIDGDVAGWARWTVREGGPSRSGRTVAVYEQQVEVRRPLMRRLAVPARPFLRANHALMMRAGRRGLERWLRRGLDDD